MHFPSVAGGIIVVIVGIVSPALVNRLIVWMVRRQSAEAGQARARGDTSGLRRKLEEIDEVLSAEAPTLFWRELTRSRRLAKKHRWSEATLVLAALDRKTLSPTQRVHLDNSLAWVKAHAGATTEAVWLAEAACAHESDVDEKSRAFLHDTLGVALALDGRHEDAVRELNGARAMGGPKWTRAVRELHLGDALAALRRVDEACAAWQHAVDAAPASEWGKLARERLVANAF
jgi:hypothetical protein